MPDRYWVGIDQNWHDDDNWSTSSGGAGGAGVPTASDDVYIDGNGYALCWATTPFVCNNFTILSGSTELCLFDQGGVINGDFEIQDGYFGPTGGGGYTVEFKGNWLKTGGTFAVGTGTGVDPTCLFSGSGKTYVLNDTGSASYQHFSVSGSYTFSGTRLAVANVSQNMSITGTVTFSDTNCFILTGEWTTHTGTITSTGGSPYVQYEVDSTVSMPTGGTIEVRTEFHIYDDFTLPARAFDGDVYVDYRADQKAFILGAGKHYFNEDFLIIADDAAVTTSAEVDCSTNDAEFRCTGSWEVDQDSFKQPSQFILSWGDGIHIFHDNLRLGLFGGTTNMSMDAGDSTIVLLEDKNIQYQHRLSRVVGGIPGTYDEQTWNRIYLLRTRSDSTTSVQFVEGFVCADGRFEVYNPVNMSVRFRVWNTLPANDTEFDKLTIIGIDESKPFFGYPVVTGFGFHARVDVNDIADIYSATICKWQSPTGDIDTYNSELWSEDSGVTEDFNFYYRDPRVVGRQKNILDERNKLTPTPAPELIIEKLAKANA